MPPCLQPTCARHRRRGRLERLPVSCCKTILKWNNFGEMTFVSCLIRRLFLITVYSVMEKNIFYDLIRERNYRFLYSFLSQKRKKKKAQPSIVLIGVTKFDVTHKIN